MKEITEDKGRIRPVVEGDFQCDENGNSTRPYEILSIVGTVDSIGKLSYISKKNVPIGIPITNEEYWYPFQVVAVPKGDKGDDGKSAYDLYIEHGGTIITEEEWLESLHGTDGNDAISPILRISPDSLSIEISSDNGQTWLPFQKDFNKLRVLGYVDSTDKLPVSANIGDIYGVWNQQAQEGAGAYELYINTVRDWTLDYTITKVYDYDTELPSSATDGTTVLVPVTDLTLDKEKIDGYKVCKFSLANNGWITILNTAEIYASKDDIVSHGDNKYALVQGEGRITETKLKENTVVSKKDYCRIVNMTDNSLMLIIVQDSKRMFHSIGTGAYMLPNNCGVYLVKDDSVTNDIVIAPSMHVSEPTHLSELEYMPEGIYPYYILTESSAGDIYITSESELTPDESEEQEGLTVETKITTLLSFKQTYELYERVVDWVYFGTNASITYHLIQNIQEGTDQNILSGLAVKDAINVISKGTNMTLTANPSIIYKEVATQVTLTATMRKAVPTNIKIFDGSTIIAEGSSNPLVYSSDFTLNGDKTFTTEGITKNVIFGNEAVVQARYPIYYGFGVDVVSVAINANRYAPTTSAAHTYSRTNDADDQHFYILVPSDISALSIFTMGGAPFVMNSERSETINGISYKVYESAYTYNAAVTLNVFAS